MATARASLRKNRRNYTTNSSLREDTAELRYDSPRQRGPSSPNIQRRTRLPNDSFGTDSDSDAFDEPDLHAPISQKDNLSCLPPNNYDFDPHTSYTPSSSAENFLSLKTSCDSGRSKILTRRSGNKRENNEEKKLLNIDYKEDAREQIKQKKNVISSNFSENTRGKRLIGGPTPVILIAMVLLVILSLFIFGHFFEKAVLKPRESNVKPLENILKDIKRDLNVLNKDMPQTRHLWTQVFSEVTNLVEDSPPQPSVLLVVVPLDSQKTATCFIQQLADIVSSAFEDRKAIMFDVESSLRQDLNSFKHDLDTSLRGLEDAHIAVIHNIEKLPPQATTLFHGYCDNENAPYKRALIIITVATQLHYDSMLVDRLDDKINHYLLDLWQGSLREVDAAAVISRIGNSPILIKPESNHLIQKLCPL